LGVVARRNSDLINCASVVNLSADDDAATSLTGPVTTLARQINGPHPNRSAMVVRTAGPVGRQKCVRLWGATSPGGLGQFPPS